MKRETIKRESTWDYDDQNGTLTYDEYHVETIETWEYSEELGRYELVYLAEKETGEYIPYNESEYIRDGVVDIPTWKKELEKKIWARWKDCKKKAKRYGCVIDTLDCDMTVQNVKKLSEKQMEFILDWDMKKYDPPTFDARLDACLQAGFPSLVEGEERKMKTYKLYGAFGKKVPANSNFMEFLKSHEPGFYHYDENKKAKGWPRVNVTVYDCNGPSWSHTKDVVLKPVQAIEIFQ